MGMRNYALRLPDDVYEMLRAEAFATGESMNAIITEAVREHLRSNRAALIEAIGRAASERYTVALDKLADL